MNPAPLTGLVVDTMVISWLLDDRPKDLADEYRELVGARPVLIAFQTLMELRYGALSAGWGDVRRRSLERRVSQLTVVQPDDATVTVCAELRQHCRRAGHALAHKVHDGDRWIAAIAIRLDIALVSHDQLFVGAPGLQLLRMKERP
ncbi:MAG TPA: PIN domain-containing protein [Actinomycetota bacterium]|nr:PIN domain-containing protein [Actinomycetota bacterium]